MVNKINMNHNHKATKKNAGKDRWSFTWYGRGGGGRIGMEGVGAMEQIIREEII